MSQMASVRVSVDVAVTPEVAFHLFTDEIGEWYRNGVARLPTGRRPGTLRFEGGVGGRLVEERDGGACLERATITVWVPGERLVFADKRSTEVEVRFHETDSGTRVVLEHRGLERLPPDAADSAAKHGWRRLGEWFEAHVRDRKDDVPEGATDG
jgi:hypothetical protein